MRAPFTTLSSQRPTVVGTSTQEVLHVVETEVGDDGAAFPVEVRLADGQVVEVELDERFQASAGDRRRRLERRRGWGR
jgi:hypothetical protein